MESSPEKTERQKPNLKPATLENKTPRQYGFKKTSRFQIAIIALACTLGLLSVLQQYFREKTKLDTLTTKIQNQIEQTKKLERDFKAVIKSAIEKVEQTKKLEKDFSNITPQIKASDLVKNTTLYTRITKETSEKNVVDQFPDCLGAQPLSLKNLNQPQSFFNHDWQKELSKKSESIELEILTRKIRDQIEKESVIFKDTVAAKYLLILHEIETQIFRISVWDLSKNKILISKIAKPNGQLLSLNYGRTRSVDEQNGSDSNHESTAQDCALSAILKEWTGEPSSQM